MPIPMKSINSRETEDQAAAWYAIDDINRRNRENKPNFPVATQMLGAELRAMVTDLYDTKNYLSYRKKFIAVKANAVNKTIALRAETNPKYKELETFIAQHKVEVVKVEGAGHLIFRLPLQK